MVVAVVDQKPKHLWLNKDFSSPFFFFFWISNKDFIKKA
jgi:hypothetical protein